MNNIIEQSLEFHKKTSGKIGIEVLNPVNESQDLNLTYTPGMAYVSLEIQNDKSKTYDYTLKSRSVAIVSNGSATLGFGNTGPEAAIPVMEGKSVIFKTFSGLDAFPLCIEEENSDAIIKFCEQIQPTFGAILLEDIKAPECFYIENELNKKLNIPVFHDDQHGTAVVVLAGLINACKVINKDIKSLKIVINGAGAAGISTANQLHSFGIQHIILVDSKGVINSSRTDLNEFKLKALEFTNPNDVSGHLKDVLKDADCFIGLSVADILEETDIQEMNQDPIVFALANPNPEIKPELALKAGAKIVATGRADYPNQINNILVFPGVLKGAIENRVSTITRKMLVQASVNLANIVKNPTSDKIIPHALDDGVCESIQSAIKS